MDTNVLKIGLVIADSDEYKPFLDYALKFNGHIQNFYNRSGCAVNFYGEDKTVLVQAICCGIGKTNAAAAAMYLAENGVDLLVSLGLSGGISNTFRGQTVIGTKFLEHDFDLTGIGYAFAEKPGQEYIYSADEKVVKAFCDTLGANSGTMVSGDKFVSDEHLRDLLKDKYSAVCCDMETAAVAYIGYLTLTPFVAVRIVSDDAGSDAYSDYADMNASSTDMLTKKLAQCVNRVLSDSELFLHLKNKKQR